MADNRPIGVFDSGLGGLTVVRELKKILKNESIVYFGDTARVPYGNRSAQTVCRYAKEDEHFLLTKNVKMIIAACGTVSSVAGAAAKGLPVPYFEMVTPAAEAAVAQTQNQKIGVIGTAATVNSKAHAKKILSLLPTAQITAVSCPLFVPLVEAGWIQKGDPVTTAAVARYLQPLRQAGVDTLIMGCTHYPAIAEIIAAYMGPGVQLINMGTPVAKKVDRFLQQHGLGATAPATYRYYVTDRMDSFSSIAAVLLGENIEDRVQTIELNQLTEEQP